jgi:hypothetical protein
VAAADQNNRGKKGPLLKDFITGVGIQKHFMGVEIPGFGLPKRFFGLTTSCFFRGGIVNCFTIK